MEKKATLPVARGLSRSQVAELLGVTDREVRKMDGRQLHPTRAGDRRWIYDLAEVRALLDRSGGEDGGGPFGRRAIVSGETTAAVFELFEARKRLPEVVIATKQTAATIMQLRAEYDRMVGGLVLSAGVVAELRKLLGACVGSDGEGLVEAVRRALYRSFQEGRADVLEWGEVRDSTTGRMRPIGPTPRRGQVTPREAAR